jgi:hypothetical protein
MSRRRLTMIAAGLAGLAALAGCSAGGDDSGGDAGRGFEAQDDADSAAGAAPPQDAPAGGVAGGAVIDTRSIIYTGTITVRVPDVDQAAETAIRLAERLGGFVGSDHRAVAGDPDAARAVLELRIPADEFPAAVDELARLGDEESREVQTQDVTEEVVDLAARIATAQASVERTRALLGRAESIEDIVAIEAELAEREAALASLAARQRRLADLTTLSTITAQLLAREAAPAAEPDQVGFLTGLAAGWRGLVRSLTLLLTGLGVLLPWLVVLGGPTAAGVWWARRRRSLPPAPTTGAPAPADPPAGAAPPA